MSRKSFLNGSGGEWNLYLKILVANLTRRTAIIGKKVEESVPLMHVKLPKKDVKVKGSHEFFTRNVGFSDSVNGYLDEKTVTGYSSRKDYYLSPKKHPTFTVPNSTSNCSIEEIQ